MKVLLILVGGLVALGGLFGGIYVIDLQSPLGINYGGSPAAYLLGGAYMLSGLISSLIFFALASIIHRLEHLEQRRN